LLPPFAESVSDSSNGYDPIKKSFRADKTHCSAAGFNALSGIKGPTGMYW